MRAASDGYDPVRSTAARPPLPVKIRLFRGDRLERFAPVGRVSRVSNPWFRSGNTGWKPVIRERDATMWRTPL
ncbi:MAG: hypothetical protein AVDCRST_MAG64-3119 [uncultured Phycisphaerae bacterium]|uniref:Uncharacterized protein n=1 Tax=uncultured Phycisphaerae bacterium TaxID=904963 RepID=A0A6J4PTV2_9BACT|nr:MAG: hypothetical protein AVDCRST_MAG64-3119 [uncultured Phycisphaerae bacterium]